MKCFEKIIINLLKVAVGGSLDEFQFAYRSDGYRGHLDNNKAYARLLVDFSSAFNTITPLN